MVRRFAAVIAVALALALPGRAEDKKSETDLGAFLQALQVKLEHTAQRANQPNAGGSSVVGLRGSKQEPLSKQLYWKGKKTETPVTPEEVKLLRSAVDQARAGQKDDAVASIKAFQEKYPRSTLAPDAQQLLAKLAVRDSQP